MTTNEQPISPEVSNQKTPEGASMSEYYDLVTNLYTITLYMTGFIFITVWIVYGITLAFNYLLGAITGVVYLRMLSRDVENVGSQKKGLSKTRLVIFAGVMVVATQAPHLKIIPVFLGFLTFKAAVIFYMLQTTLLPKK